MLKAAGAMLSHAQLLRLVEIQSEIIAAGGDLTEVMDLVARRATQMTGADAGVVEMPEGAELVYRAASGRAAPHIGLRVKIAGSLSGECLRHGTTLRSDDTQTDPRTDSAACRVIGARSMLCVPLRHRAAVVGVLKVYAARRAAFDHRDGAVLELLSGAIAAHIARTADFTRLDQERRRYHGQAVAGLRALARAIDAKDAMTRQHSDRVAGLAVAIALRREWCEERAALLREAALLHDVGKIGIPDSILLKPGPLDSEEYARVKEHAPLGAAIVDGVLSAEQVAWIRWHHERPDGQGYPDALTDSEIPEGAAIIALADTWDVMTGSRPYRPPLNQPVALRECQQLAGHQFRQTLVDVLTDLLQVQPDLAGTRGWTDAARPASTTT